MHVFPYTIIALSLVLVMPPSILGAPALQGRATHVVAAGETLWAISRQHGVTPDAIARASDLPSPDRLQVGQALAIPAVGDARDKIPPLERHTVQAGDTVWSIARMHRMTPAAVARLNNLPDEHRLQIGVILRVAGGSPAAPVPRVRPTGTTASGMAWPSRGVLTSRFGFRWGRHHHGIDIAAAVGTPIIAARDGVVTFVGWFAGYGRLVILDHGAGLTTWYGHASLLLVEAGQRVRRGQLIARVGATGYVTGPNLHFEVRRNNRPMDPLRFLGGIR